MSGPRVPSYYRRKKEKKKPPNRPFLFESSIIIVLIIVTHLSPALSNPSWHTTLCRTNSHQTQTKTANLFQLSCLFLFRLRIFPSSSIFSSLLQILPNLVFSSVRSAVFRSPPFVSARSRSISQSAYPFSLTNANGKKLNKGIKDEGTNQQSNEATRNKGEKYQEKHIVSVHTLILYKSSSYKWRTPPAHWPSLLAFVIIVFRCRLLVFPFRPLDTIHQILKQTECVSGLSQLATLSSPFLLFLFFSFFSFLLPDPQPRFLSFWCVGVWRKRQEGLW